MSVLRLPIKPMRFLLYIVVGIAVNGCAWPALREIDYHGQIPVNANVALAKQFASDLAAEAGLKITYVIPQANLKPGAYSLIFLNRERGGNPRIGVVITTRVPDNVLYISVNGDIESPEAQAIAQKAVDLFKKKYPDSPIVPFTRHSGPLGP
jgi:hypothetical protein